MCELLTVKGGTNRVIEYFGPGTASISCTGKGTITNMGAELGATTSIFPSDEQTRKYLEAQGRGKSWTAAAADPDATYDETLEIHLDQLEPLIARPHSPDSVVKVREVAGTRMVKAFRVVDESVLEEIRSWSPDFFFLDTFSRHAVGGTGETFDWSIARRAAALGRRLGPRQAAVLMEPGAIQLLRERGVLLHGRDVEVVIVARRLAEGVGPREARARGSAAGRAGVQDGDTGATLSQAIGDVRADAAGPDDDDHGRRPSRGRTASSSDGRAPPGARCASKVAFNQSAVRGSTTPPER